MKNANSVAVRQATEWEREFGLAGRILVTQHENLINVNHEELFHVCRRSEPFWLERIGGRISAAV